MSGSWTVQKTSDGHVVLDASGDILARVSDRPSDPEALLRLQAEALAEEGTRWIEANIADGASPPQAE
jgi:hypothetical protein